MNTQFLVPITARDIRTDISGAMTMALLHQQLAQHRSSVILIDMQRVSWIDAHLAAMLMIIIRHSQARENVVQFVNMAERISAILQKNGFLAQRRQDNYRTTMPLIEFHPTAGVEFSHYARTHLRRPEMPSMTDALTGKFYEGIDELFANSSLHSQTQRQICVGGQFFPNLENLSFVIADGGRGIDGAYLAKFGSVIKAHDAIEWAMQPGNTTRMGDVPGGLGLKLIRSFVEKNGGRLTIISNDGYWCQSGTRTHRWQMQAPFPGTAVVFEIVTSDRKRYDLGHAPDPRDIW